MKKTIFVFLAILVSALSLSACVKNQNTDANGNVIPAGNQTVNDTNYQNMLQEQSQRATEEEQADRAADISAAHGGGRR